MRAAFRRFYTRLKFLRRVLQEYAIALFFFFSIVILSVADSKIASVTPGGPPTGEMTAIKFRLVDRASREEDTAGKYIYDTIPGFEAIPDNTLIYMGKIESSSLDIVATIVTAAEVGSVEFVHKLPDRSRPTTRTENESPYTLVVDDTRLNKGLETKSGLHTLTATAYTKSNGRGHVLTTSTIHFTIVEDVTKSKTTDLQGNEIACHSSAANLGANDAFGLNAGQPPSESGIYTQSFMLQPGWNALYFNIEPANNQIAHVFRDLPVACIATTLNQENRAALVYHPFALSETNLHRIHAHRTYLVNLDITTTQSWEVSGTPRLRVSSWRPNSVNEVGLRVDPANPPAFDQYLSSLSADGIRKIEQIRSDGTWQEVDGNDQIRADLAYRVHTNDLSDKIGELGIELDLGDGLDMDRSLVERSFIIQNHSPLSQTITVTKHDSAQPLPLLYRQLNPTTGTTAWLELEQPITIPADTTGRPERTTLGPGERVELHVAVQRADFAPTQEQGMAVLVISSNNGAQELVTVRALHRNPLSNVTGSAAGAVTELEAEPVVDQSESADATANTRGLLASSTMFPMAISVAEPNAGSLPQPAAAEHAGLWIGTVIVNKVSNAHPIKPDVYFDLELNAVHRDVVTDEAAPANNAEPRFRDARTVLVTAGSEWHYLDHGFFPGDDWIKVNFDDSAWKSGPAGFGFAAQGAKTQLETGPDKARHTTYYFRKEFTPSDETLAAVEWLDLRLRCDDGAVLYLNGSEIARVNMPDKGPIDHTTAPLARISGDDAETFVAIKLESAKSELTATNVLAVEIHQYPGELKVTQDANMPTATASEFQFRILLHVDVDGRTRLLKDVIQMRTDGDANHPSGSVLLTDDSLINGYKGVALRDGEPVGRRVSTAAYDFPDDDKRVPGTRKMRGSFGQGDTLSVTLPMPADFVTNPFKHKYHPDHDNLADGIGTPLEPDLTEAYAITRTLQLDFAGPEALDVNQPGWGDTLIGGTYSELISGLHREDIHVEGIFILQSADTNPVLNQPQSGQ